MTREVLWTLFEIWFRIQNPEYSARDKKCNLHTFISISHTRKEIGLYVTWKRPVVEVQFNDHLALLIALDVVEKM